MTVDRKYADLLGSRLQKFSVKNNGRVWNFRCPYCGDSQRDKKKARGYLFLKKNDIIYKCHNCGVGKSLGNFLKDNAPDLYDEFVMERYKSGLTGKGRNVSNPVFVSKRPKFVSKPTGLQSISDLNISHPAVRYLQNRELPQDAYKRLYYVDRFQDWVNAQKKTFPDSKLDHPRIIIPLIDSGGSWFGFQGRSLNPKDKLRYITVMLDDAKTKIYGQESINPDETVYVTEGPFDSYFLTNAIAMCGSDVDHSSLPYRNRIWVFDNEPRSREITNKIDRAISEGEKVVIWPTHIEQKDLNDMSLSGHEVKSIVESNVYSGLQAQVKFSEWKKV
jgi:predicted RNA-binding Zn-ribbon protein involved in translation (DUF1610 family)